MDLCIFSDRASCERALGAQLETRVASAIAERSFAFAALAGGATPIALYQRIGTRIDSSRLRICPTDERWGPLESQNRNGLMLSKIFKQAQLISSPFSGEMEPDAASWFDALEANLPFDICLLGMGEDGHIASIFPHMDNAELALDLSAFPAILTAQAPVEPRLRLTPNLAMLLKTRWLGLLIYGEAKRELIERAALGQCPELPIQALLAQKHHIVHVYWAP